MQKPLEKTSSTSKIEVIAGSVIGRYNNPNV
jgi:hypothetical protein